MITVVAVTGLVTVQDGGRPGHMHEGVPPGGPLVPELLARANAAVGNADGDAGLEVFGGVSLVGPRGTQVASDDGIPHELAGPAPAPPWRVACEAARVRYVAVRGGIDVPLVLGGRGTLLGAGFGGLEGRALRRGDALGVGMTPLVPPRDVALLDLAAPLRVIPGPDLDRFPVGAIEVLRTAVFTVDPRSDRTGIRLTGPAIPCFEAPAGVLSAPMVRGAIQVPSAKSLIVLGPDHPTTGGYPVLATLVQGSFGVLGGRPTGAEVRFVLEPSDNTRGP